MRFNIITRHRRSQFFVLRRRSSGFATRVLACGIAHIVEDLTGELDVIVREFADFRIVDTENLGLFACAEGETGDEVHDEEDDAGTAEGVDTTGDGVSELVAELDPVVVEPSTRDLSEAVQMRYVVCGEESREDVADETTDGMLGEDVESIVDAEDELELGGVVGTGGSDDTVDDSGPCGNETGSRSDGYKTGDDSGAEPDSGPFALKTVIENTPGDTSDASGQVSYDGCHNSTHVCSESGTIAMLV
jgi:hypothetical protein